MTDLEERINELEERLPINTISPAGYMNLGGKLVPRWKVTGYDGVQFTADTLGEAVDAGLKFCDEEDEA
ncbi:MAG: hypothetical protein GY841_10295 [FCB group bacterium]|nr:hypothetical protein [FCB group bacterium]